MRGGWRVLTVRSERSCLWRSCSQNTVSGVIAHGQELASTVSSVSVFSRRQQIHTLKKLEPAPQDGTFRIEVRAFTSTSTIDVLLSVPTSWESSAHRISQAPTLSPSYQVCPHSFLRRSYFVRSRLEALSSFKICYPTRSHSVDWFLIDSISGETCLAPRVGERGISLWCHSGSSFYPPSRSHTEYSHIRRCCVSHTTYPRTLPSPLDSQFYGTLYRGATDGTGHRSGPPGVTPLAFDLTMGRPHPRLVDEPQWRQQDATPDRLADPIQSLAKAQS